MHPKEFLHIASQLLGDAMHIKKRNGQAMLYRSTWVKKGSEGNTHGFTRQQFVGSLAFDSEVVSAELAAKLTPDEKVVLENKILLPAKQMRLAKETEIEQRRTDPSWRLDEAVRLIKEAASLSSPQKRVSDWRVKAVQDALTGVAVFGDKSIASKRPDVTDPLADALCSLKSASKAIMDAHYGRAQEGAARNSAVYKTWLQISGQIDGEAGPDSLLRALQAMGWVKAKAGR